MKTLQELKKAQAELDKEIVEPCPKCETSQSWGIWRKAGCLECYYRAEKNDTNQS